MDAPRIETARLILRPPCWEDFDAWAAFHADPEVTRFLGGPQPRSVAWRSLMTMAGAWSLRGFAMFSVVEKAGGRWVGRLGPWRPEGWPSTEIGWGVAREHWRRGYAVEGAAAAIDWAFGQLGWSEIIHVIHPDNHASQAVARKLGSRLLRRGRLPAPMDDTLFEIWGQSGDEWRARHR